MDLRFSMRVDPATHLILEADLAFLLWTGRTSDRLLGRPLSQWVRDPSREDLMRALSVAHRTPEPRKFRVQVQADSGHTFSGELRVSRPLCPGSQPLLEVCIEEIRSVVSTERLSA